MSSLQDFFVELTENRLQQSLARISITDNRALGLLGLVTVLMGGLWAVYLAPTLHHTALPGTMDHDRVIVALVVLTISLFAAGYSLLLTVQYDNPDMAEFYQKYYADNERAYAAYFASAIQAISLNNAVAQRKSRLLLASTLSLFVSVLVIII
ncbi:hypothetical protein [Sulfobacillus harzensis]|uniref:Uncharacterized protein n=1 Tax=Sulfobacillus harzensis TaxID=2729629 RepID=A0A7Y0L1Q6_9FIRM|nr:hypothetical protein [Sulfobacillus harzensis]NMP21668.1 hypothetical protein [Sulfobacillus harzensis]